MNNSRVYRERDGKIHILFFTSWLGGGGAEMHLLRIINHLDRQKFSLSLALTRSGGSYETALANDVDVHFLNTGKISSSTVRMIQSISPLRRLIQAEQPDILCSVMDHANIVAILASSALPTRPKVVLSVQIPPFITCRHSWHIVKRLLRFLIPRLYARADRIVALSRGVAEDLTTLVPEVSDRTEVIYNAGVDARVLSGASDPLPAEALPQNGPLIVACGRLTELKGFSYLLDALVRVRSVIPAHLWIIGEGEQRRYLEKKIKQLNLTDCVRLLGFQHNPFKYMAAADVFVVSSLFEGFGNVIVEAMACSAPVIATSCPYGPSEIIKDGANGILVPPVDEKALSQAIIRVLTDEVLKQRLSRNGKERSQDFNAGTIASLYGDLFLRVINM